MLVYQRLRKYIDENGIKQTHVAGRVNSVDVKALNAILNGNRKLSADEFEDICINGLRISPEYFLVN
jgi:transcriptional regulator with XRE-family HTH domain